MELAFATKRLRQLCESRARARTFMGVTASESLQKRLADIEAADNVLDIPWLNSAFSQDGTAVIEFQDGYKLELVAIQGGKPVSAQDNVNWSKIDRVKLLDVIKP